MNKAKKTIIKQFSYTLKKRLNSVFFGKKPQSGRYDFITLTEEEMDREEYKNHLGGGADGWQERGRFQLFFLQKMGVDSSSRVLDVGCGPGRASRHLIDFLSKNNYCGVDYNSSFINVAKNLVRKEGLNSKNPYFSVIENFNFENIGKNFDYVIVFSVLNHCNDRQKKHFFENVNGSIRPGGKVYITHATWFRKKHLKVSNMKLTRQIDPIDIDITKFGWPNRDSIFPIIELTKLGKR